MSQTGRLGTRLLMGIPTLTSNPRHPDWVDAMTGLQMPLGSSMGKVWVKDKPIAEARNILCQAALDANVDYLFMLGDDVMPPANALMTMLNKIGRQYVVDGTGPVRASMVTGTYWTKSYPPEPYLFKGLLKGSYKDWLAGEFFPVDFAGCDCLLLEVAMLREIPFPWFSTDWVWEEGQESSPIATEDYYFYTVAKQAGFTLFADTSIQCLHKDRHTGAAFGLEMDMVQAGGTPVVGTDEVLVADIGAGLFTPPSLFGPKAKIVRFDIRSDIKPDVRCDIRAIDTHWFGKFDFVNVHHVLEHFRRIEAPELVAHWCKLLKPGGRIIIGVPNFAHAVQFILDPPATASGVDRQYAWQQVYGDQSEEGSPWEHKNGFTASKLENLLRVIPGLADIEVQVVEDGQNLRGEATVATVVQPYALVPNWTENA